MQDPADRDSEVGALLDGSDGEEVELDARSREGGSDILSRPTSATYGSTVVADPHFPDASREEASSNTAAFMLQVFLDAAIKSFPFLINAGMAGEKYFLAGWLLLTSWLYRHHDCRLATGRLLDDTIEAGESALAGVPTWGYGLQWAGYAWDLLMVPAIVYACMAAPQAKDGIVSDELGEAMWVVFAIALLSQAASIKQLRHPWRHTTLERFFGFYAELWRYFTVQPLQWVAMVSMLAWRTVAMAMPTFFISQTALAAFASQGETVYPGCLSHGDDRESVRDCSILLMLVACVVSNIPHGRNLQGVRKSDCLSMLDIPLGQHVLMLTDCAARGGGHYFLIQATLAAWSHDLSCSASLDMADGTMSNGAKVAAILLASGEALMHYATDWCAYDRRPSLVEGPGGRSLWTPRMVLAWCQGRPLGSGFDALPAGSPP